MISLHHLAYVFNRQKSAFNVSVLSAIRNNDFFLPNV